MDVAELSMFLESLEPGASVSPEEFERAAEVVKGMKGLDNDQRLQLYGLYKQSTVGDIDISKPYFYDAVGAAKWDAWKAYEGFPRTNAAIAYVYIANNLLEEGEGGGYGVNSNNGKSSSVFDGMGVTVSTLAASGAQQQVVSWTEEESAFKAIAEEDLGALEKSIAIGGVAVTKVRDENGMTPLHFAADRGLLEFATCLLSAGADVNGRDNDGQTPLMLAVMCEHESMITLLIDQGADVGIRNESGETVFDLDGIDEAIIILLGSRP